MTMSGLRGFAAIAFIAMSSGCERRVHDDFENIDDPLRYAQLTGTITRNGLPQSSLTVEVRCGTRAASATSEDTGRYSMDLVALPNHYSVDSFELQCDVVEAGMARTAIRVTFVREKKDVVPQTIDLAFDG